MSPSKKDIIIVGAGGAGTQVARAFSEQLSHDTHSIILVESREFYVHYPATLRMLTSEKDSLEEKVLVPYDKLLVNGNGKIVRSSVTSIVRDASGKGGHIETESGESFHYDVLVLATGSTREGPLAFPSNKKDAIDFINDWRQKIMDADGIAIVGGGAVGSEIAGEIRDIYADKKISVIHRGNHLLGPVYPDKYRADVDRRWAERNINLILNDEIDDISTHSTSQVTTDKGTKLDANLLIPCRGGRPNTAFIASLGKDVLTPSGHVKVDQHLQVQGIPGVFAAGDIIDWDEVKQVAKYGGHCATIVANVKDVLVDKPPSAVYKSMFELIVLTNGASGGAAYMGVLWGLRFGNTFAKMIKSKELFVAKTRAGLGY